MNVGFLGGSFDPVHKGHLALAKAALQELRLARVYFVLAPRSPFKKGQPTPVSHRLRMLQLALKGTRQFKLGLWELRRPGASYTIDTLKSYKKAHPKDEVVLIIGSDLVKGFRKWRNPSGILKLARVVVGRRPGARALIKAPFMALKGTFPAVSSTQIRKKTNTILLPSLVLAYIRKKNLYETNPSRSHSRT